MKYWFRGAIATLLFEVRRSLTLQRMSVSMVLIAFPPAILTILLAMPTSILVEFELFITLSVSIVCLLSLLLWATPNVYSELEGKSWSFVASRPGGRISNFLGKYLVSVCLSSFVSIASLTICVAMAGRFVGLRNVYEFWGALSGIFFIASVVYGSIFSLMGTIFIKRAMVVGAGFIVMVEVFAASLPVVFSRFTARFHLQSLGMLWNDPKILPLTMEQYEEYYLMASPVTTPFHLGSLSLLTFSCVLIGCLVIVNREYVTSDQA